MNVQELIDHLSDKPTPSWDLDREIANATDKHVLETKRYTSDLVSAIALLPWGWAWMVGCAPGEGFFATVQTTEESGMDPHDLTANGATPALAMTNVALQAWQWTKDLVR